MELRGSGHEIGQQRRRIADRDDVPSLSSSQGVRHLSGKNVLREKGVDGVAVVVAKLPGDGGPGRRVR